MIGLLLFSFLGLKDTHNRWTINSFKHIWFGTNVIGSRCSVHLFVWSKLGGPQCSSYIWNSLLFLEKATGSYGNGHLQEDRVPSGSGCTQWRASAPDWLHCKPALLILHLVPTSSHDYWVTVLLLLLPWMSEWFSILLPAYRFCFFPYLSSSLECICSSPSPQVSSIFFS